MGILPDFLIERYKPLSPMEPGEKRPGKISYGLSSYGYDARIGYKFKIFTPALCAEVDPKNFDEKAFVEVDITPANYLHNWIDITQVSDGKLRSFYCTKCKANAKNLHDPTVARTTYCNTPPAFIRIPPNSFVLGESIETFKIPRDVMAVVLGKSTYARCGLIVNVTPLEPEWEGKVTVEISNTTPLPARIYAGEGIMQVLFFQTAGIVDLILSDIKQLYKYAGHPVDEELANRIIKDTTTCRVSYADKKGKYQNQEGLTLPEVDK